MAHGDTLDDNLARAREMTRRAAQEGARIVVLPEYFFSPFDGRGPPAAAQHARAIRDALATTSRELHVALAGNVLEAAGAGFQNVGVVYDDGRLALEQAKVHPMPREAASGVEPGGPLHAARAAGHAVGMLVCADILYPEAARILQLAGAEILLNPVMSPYREDDPTKDARDALFVARAWDSGAFVLKAGGHRRRATPPQVAGRSLIAAPWGMLARYRDDFADELVMADLDFGKLRRHREAQATFPARRPSAYRALVDEG